MIAERRILLAGCGRWGRNVLRDLRELGCRVVVCDIAPEGRRAALTLGAEAAVDRIEFAPTVDGAVVATPTLKHESTVMEILDRRVPIFCEKPLTADAASAARLAGAGADRLFVMDKWRYHPAVELLAGVARSGASGRLRRLSTRRLQPALDGYDVDAIRVLAPHEISIGREILGPLPEPASADGELRADGQGELEARFRGEVDWTFRVSSLAPERIRSIEVVFDTASCSWTLMDEFTVRIRRGSGEDRVPLEPAAPLRRELGAFVAFLDGGPPPKTTAREGAETVGLLERLCRMAGI